MIPGSVANEADPANVGFALVIWRGVISLTLAVVGVALIVTFRARLVPLVSTRTRRFLVEVLALGAMQLVVAALFAVIDFPPILHTGRLQAHDDTLIWALVLAIPLTIWLQTFAFVHLDATEVERGVIVRERDDARAERTFFDLINQAFLAVVSSKRERLGKSKADNCAELISALNPSAQIARLITACWQIFDTMINDGSDQGITRHRVRVAYFRVDAGNERLVCDYSWNGTAGDCVPARVRDHLSLQGSSPSLAVAAAKDGRVYCVPDPLASDRDAYHPFTFFDETEKNVLKSIVAIPIKLDGDAAPYDVLVVDTARPGFFDSTETWQQLQLNQICIALAHRLHMEKRLLLHERANHAEIPSSPP
jgi:hypothetical protein